VPVSVKQRVGDRRVWQVRVDPHALDAPRPPVTLTRVSQLDSASRGMVAELMVLAGHAVGVLGELIGIELPVGGWWVALVGG
jgi:hypothetical protein